MGPDWVVERFLAVLTCNDPKCGEIVVVSSKDEGRSSDRAETIPCSEVKVCCKRYRRSRPDAFHRDIPMSSTIYFRFLRFAVLGAAARFCCRQSSSFPSPSPSPVGGRNTDQGSDFHALCPGVPYGDQSPPRRTPCGVLLMGVVLPRYISAVSLSAEGPEPRTCGFIVRSARVRARAIAGVLHVRTGFLVGG
jgi:hypothetical protein